MLDHFSLLKNPQYFNARWWRIFLVLIRHLIDCKTTVPTINERFDPLHVWVWTKTRRPLFYYFIENGFHFGNKNRAEIFPSHSRASESIVLCHASCPLFVFVFLPNWIRTPDVHASVAFNSEMGTMNTVIARSAVWDLEQSESCILWGKDLFHALFTTNSSSI